jgi:Exopolyphosphatase-related proteins
VNIVNTNKLFSLIIESKKIAIIGHSNPDGDCIGSVSALYNYLVGLGKSVSSLVPNKYPLFLSFLDPHKSIYDASSDIAKTQIIINNADLIICVDFNGLKRIDDLGPIIKKSNATKVLIDHHPQPDQDFDVIFSRPDLSSASELTYWILKEIDEKFLKTENKSYFNLHIYTALYTGMMTDTNNFSNSVVASTFAMASNLISVGVDKEMIQNEVFGGFSENRMRLMGYMLYNNIHIYRDLQASVMVITQKIKDEFNFEIGDSEGFVNLGLNIKGIKVAALFTENQDTIRVSLRSKGTFSVNSFARKYFNGGGHERAAGGKLFMNINDVENYFIKSLKEFSEDNNTQL